MTRPLVARRPDIPGARWAVIVLAIATLASCSDGGDTDAAPVVTVDVAPVLHSSIQRTIRADALLYPYRQAAIIPKIAAPIRKEYVQKGARVRANQLLMELENQDLAGAAIESRAVLERAQATFETTVQATVPQDVQRAELELRAAKDALDAQQAVFDGRQNLFREGAISQRDLNDAQVALSQARTRFETAQKRLDDLRRFAREQALRAAAAERDAARGRDEAAQAQLGYSRITSPIDGVVTDLPFYPGESAPPGAPVVTVMDLSRVIARAHIPQGEAMELAVGNEARLIGPDGAPIPARVVQISPALDPANTTVEVWVQADNGDGRLRAGASVRAEMVARTVPDALVVPQAAVLTSPSGSTYGIVIDGENAPHLRKITVGIRDGGLVQVTDGLEDGQRVATTGAFELFKLDPDVLSRTKVQIAPAKKEDEPEET